MIKACAFSPKRGVSPKIKTQLFLHLVLFCQVNGNGDGMQGVIDQGQLVYSLHIRINVIRSEDNSFINITIKYIIQWRFKCKTILCFALYLGADLSITFARMRATIDQEN